MTPGPPRYERSAPFAVHVADSGGVRVVAVEGDVDIVTSNALARAAADAPPRVVLDLCACRFLDSSGLGVLLRLLRDHGERFAVARRPGSPPARVLELTGVAQLPAYDTVDAAVAAVRAAA